MIVTMSPQFVMQANCARAKISLIASVNLNYCYAKRRNLRDGGVARGGLVHGVTLFRGSVKCDKETEWGGA